MVRWGMALGRLGDGVETEGLLAEEPVFSGELKVVERLLHKMDQPSAIHIAVFQRIDPQSFSLQHGIGGGGAKDNGQGVRVTMDKGGQQGQSAGGLEIEQQQAGRMLFQEAVDQGGGVERAERCQGGKKGAHAGCPLGVGTVQQTGRVGGHVRDASSIKGNDRIKVVPCPTSL